MQALDALVDPEEQRQWDLQWAEGINDLGQIAGHGTWYGRPTAQSACRLDPAYTVPYGTGCGGIGSTLPALAGDGLPMIGGTFGLRIAGGVSSSAAVVAFSAAPASLPLPGGCTLLLSTLDAPLVLPVDAGGRARVDLAVPASVGPGVLYAQGFLVDLPGGALKISTTAGLRIELR